MGDVSSSTLIAPQSRRLPMGHTHSVFLLMSINRVCIDKAIAYFKDWRIVFFNDEDVFNTGCRLGPKTLAIYLHVDDFGIIGTVAWACELLAQHICMELKNIGFDSRSLHARTWTVMLVWSCDLNQHSGFQLATGLQHWMQSSVS